MFENLNDKEFGQQLRNIKPNKSYNRNILEEISKRGKKNNLYVINYLKELENLNICNYERQAVLLNQFEVTDKSNKFVKTEIKFKEFQNHSYDYKKVVYSLRNRKINQDLKTFTNSIEKILESTKLKSSIKEKEYCIIEIETNQKVIMDFVKLVQRFRIPKRTKLDLAIFKDLQKGSLSFIEAWFDFFEGILSTSSVLFVFYFICMENLKVLKYQILKRMIEDLIGGIDLRIFEETEIRFKSYLDNNLLNESNEREEENFKGILIETEEKEEEKKEEEKKEEEKKEEEKASKEILEWYKLREDAFTNTKN